MTDRDRLIELINQKQVWGIDQIQPNGFKIELFENEDLADYLLANGVIVPPCKVGQTVYVVSRYYAGDWEVYKCEIDTITIYEKNTFISCVANDVKFGKINFGLNISEIGKTVFLTKEEAEAELEKRGKENEC